MILARYSNTLKGQGMTGERTEDDTNKNDNNDENIYIDEIVFKKG